VLSHDQGRIATNVLRIEREIPSDEWHLLTTGWVMLKDRDGQAHYTHGICHQGEDVPAVVLADGTVEYAKDGYTHRNRHKGPAVIHADGRREYWEEGVFICDGEPETILATTRAAT